MGSCVYVQRIISKIPDGRVHLSTPVAELLRISDISGDRVKLMTSSGTEEIFDHVILACHSDEVLELFKEGGLTQKETRILGSFGWNKNRVLLHSDPKVSMQFSKRGRRIHSKES